MTDVEKKRKWIINLIYYASILALIYLFYKYALGLFFPLIFAFFVAAILQRPKNHILKKTPIKKGLASTICVFTLIFIVLGVISVIGVRVAGEIKGFIDYVTIQIQNIDEVINNVENALLNLISNLPEFISVTLTDSLSKLFTQIREMLAGEDSELTSQITSGLSNTFSLSWITTPLTGVISTAKQIPSILIAIVITLVCSCFMTSDYDNIISFIKYQFPEKRRNDISRGKALLKSSLWKMAKAYAAIMAITFGEIFLGLSVLSLLGIYQSSYIVIISIVTAIVDIIPVLGTGTILIPWAAYSLITGNFSMAIGLAIIYGAVTVIRQIMEPKLVATQLGLPPFLTISAMYIGLKVFGVFGVFILPITIIMLKLLNDEGIIKLWKSPKKQLEAPQENEEKTLEETAENPKE